MKVALVYDRVNKWGGAERVLLALHRIFPDAPLYTSVYNKKTASWAKSFLIITSFLQHIKTARNTHEAFPYLMPQSFEAFTFDQYDVVISVTSEAAKGVLTKPDTIHICYCLTPTRYLWSGYPEYFKNPLFRFLTRPVVSYLHTWDKIAAHRPDHFIAISEEVRKRIKTYYQKESSVVYPPVTLGDRKPMVKSWHDEPFDKGYFLVISRLVPYKKIRLAIEACNTLKLPLKIIGTGNEEELLRSIAGDTIEFLGNLTDESIMRYYRGGNALLFPGLEDFGLTIVEAQKFGCPVIAFRGGGALETIIEGKTGLFFYPHTKQALIKTLKTFIIENTGLSRKEFEKKYSKRCKENAARFSEAVFEKEIRTYVEKMQNLKVKSQN